jgi:hypothetical protein
MMEQIYENDHNQEPLCATMHLSNVGTHEN